MLNKIIIKQIMNQLLEDTFFATFIIYKFTIEKRKQDYEIIVTAILNNNVTTINKIYKIRVKNWVQMLTGYEYAKDKIRKILIEEIDKDTTY